ncbi:MAG: hypothetical protein K6E36_01485 [Oscillospiraceae bacterium]|nr:hypothetical protein [Oscillospiraceae bacterium]
METVFPIMLLVFGGAMLLYAGLVALCGFEVIPRTHSSKIRDKKRYARQFAALIAILGWAPVAAGICGLIFGNTVCLIVLIAALIFAIWLARYIMRNSND